MGRDTEWADDTWNPAIGCSKVSAGCRGCYMMRGEARWGRDGTVVRRTSPGTFNLPIAKDRAGAWKVAPGRLVFTASMTDVFHEGLDDFRDDVWARMEQRPDLLFLVLTKRPERIQGRLPAWWGPHGPQNVALGVSAEDQAAWDARVPLLLDVPARLRFVSVEPMIGPITHPHGLRPDDAYANDWMTPDRPGIGWVIIGGESGPGARPLHPAWVGDLIVAADDNGVGVHFKQWGEWAPIGALDEETTNGLYRSNRVAREDEDQAALDDSYGRTCTVPQLVLRADGAHRSIDDRKAFWIDPGEHPAPHQAFRVGKHRSGRTFRGRTYDARPTWPLEAP